jgi:hypothetical protein
MNGSVFTFGSSEKVLLYFSKISKHELKIIPRLPPIKQVCAEKNQAIFLDYDGRVWFIGTNSVWFNPNIYGVPQSHPHIHPHLSGIVQIDSKNEHFFALDYSGKVWCSGQNQYNCLGLTGSSENSDVVIIPEVNPFLCDIIKVYTAGNIHCAIDSSRRVFLWGNSATQILYSGNLLHRLRELALGLKFKSKNIRCDKLQNDYSRSYEFRQTYAVLLKIIESMITFGSDWLKEELIDRIKNVFTDEECEEFLNLIAEIPHVQSHSHPRIVEEFCGCTVIINYQYIISADKNGLVNYYSLVRPTETFDIRWFPTIQFLSQTTAVKSVQPPNDTQMFI